MQHMTPRTIHKMKQGNLKWKLYVILSLTVSTFEPNKIIMAIPNASEWLLHVKGKQYLKLSHAAFR